MRKTLRRRVEAALAELNLVGPPTIDNLKAHLEQVRGRPIVIEPAPVDYFVDAACGAWWESRSVDVILVPDNADALTKDHTVRHEFAHMILRHRGTACAGLALLELLELVMPDLNAEKVGALLLHQRSDYSSDAEREAELLASLLTLHAGAAAIADTEADALRRALSGEVQHG